MERSAYSFVVLLAFSVALSATTKLDLRIQRSALVTPYVMAVGGVDIASASDEDVFGQNPALLTFQHRATAREGYGKYLDEDLVYLARRMGGRFRFPGLNFGMSLFADMSAVTTFLEYSGMASMFMGPSSALPLYILGLAGISFNTNHTPSSLTNIADMSNFYNAMQTLLLSGGLDINFSFYSYVPVSGNFAFMVGNRAQFLFLPGFRNDLAIDLAFATQLPGVNRMSFGLTARAFNRYAIEIKSDLDLIDIASNDFIVTSANIYISAIQNALATFGASLINGVPYSNMAPVYIGTGISIDIGYAWRINREWRIGAVIEDVYSPISWWDGRRDVIPMNIKVGATYSIPFSFPGLFENPEVIMGLDDLLFRKYDNLLLKTHAGIRFGIFDKFAVVHIGLNQGYPSVMLSKSFDFSFFRYTPFLKPLTPPKYTDGIWPFVFPDYTPIIIPLTEDETRRYLSENIFVYVAQWAACIVLTGNLEFAAGVYGYENGSYPGQLPVYVGFGRLNLFWYF